MALKSVSLHAATYGCVRCYCAGTSLRNSAVPVLVGGTMNAHTLHAWPCSIRAERGQGGSFGCSYAQHPTSSAPSCGRWLDTSVALVLPYPPRSLSTVDRARPGSAASTAARNHLPRTNRMVAEDPASSRAGQHGARVP
eukprot:365123-Chlamydomonas_euryale.AAC.35